MRVAGSSAESNVGRKRRHNEDNFVSAPPVFAVADGMGGAQAGEVASELAADTVRQTEFAPSVSGKERVVALIKAANLRVHERATVDATASGMGTTMTVAMLQPNGTLAIGHVGDSRAYRLRDGELEQLTDDHSLVGELVRRGELTPEEAAVHPQRSVITRALGTEPDVDVDVFTVEARDGDIFLLCSDGLTTMVDPETIAAILRRNGTHLDAATAALIKAANDRGGDDNITAVLFAVADGDADHAPTLPIAPPVPDPDLEDTLHPEDNVTLPDAAPAEVTMVVSGDELAKALEAGRQSETHEAAPAAAAAVAGAGAGAAASIAAEPPETELPAEEAPHASPGETAPDLTTAWPAVAAGEAGEPPAGEEHDEVPEEKASPARVAIALLVIVLLVVAIVLLVLDALPR
jgi:serine/threonine protein phosphatase PrpC